MTRGVQAPRHHQDPYLGGVLGAPGVVVGGIWKETVLRLVSTNLHP